MSREGAGGQAVRTWPGWEDGAGTIGPRPAHLALECPGLYGGLGLRPLLPPEEGEHSGTHRLGVRRGTERHFPGRPETGGGESQAEKTASWRRPRATRAMRRPSSPRACMSRDLPTDCVAP